jgi:hypothetical protein
MTASPEPPPEPPVGMPGGDPGSLSGVGIEMGQPLQPPTMLG